MEPQDKERPGSWFSGVVIVAIGLSTLAYFALSESIRVHAGFVVDSVRKVLRVLS